MVAFFVANVTFLFAQPPLGTWTLVAEDNFDSTSLDTKMWGYGSTPWGTENQSSFTLIPAADTWVSDGSWFATTKQGDYETWHTYGLLWEPNSLTWYMDGEVIYLGDLKN